MYLYSIQVQDVLCISQVSQWGIVGSYRSTSERRWRVKHNRQEELQPKLPETFDGIAPTGIIT